MTKTTENEIEQKKDFDLFEALGAIDKKDYNYYDRLAPEQQKKFIPFMMIHWLSAVKASQDIQEYYLQSTNYHGNMYLFNENIQKHPKIVWLMLCAASPGLGKQFHSYIPHIRERVAKLKDVAKQKEIKDYYTKIYAKTASKDEINLLTDAYLDNQRKKMYIAEIFPEIKYDEIELLAELITDEEIEQHKRDTGN